MLVAMTAIDRATLLRANPIFAGIPAPEINALARLATEETHAARAFVFMEGDAARWLYIVRSGHVKIVRHSKTGKDVVLELLGAGEIFGGVAVLEKRPYPAAAQATERALPSSLPPLLPRPPRVPAPAPVRPRLAPSLVLFLSILVFSFL